MTKKTPLTKEEMKLIKADIAKSSNELIYSFVAIILINIIGLFIIFTINIPSDIVSPNTLAVFLILITLGILWYFSYKKLKGPIGDYNAGIKLVYQGVIADKNTHTEYLSYRGTVSNMYTQPKVVSHYIYLKDIPFYLTKEDYQKYFIGEHIKISLTKKTKKIIKIEKLN